MKLSIKLALSSLIIMPATFVMANQKVPLHHAAADCNANIDSVFNQDRSAIMKKDGDGNIPLHEAAAFGCKRNIENLLEHGLEHLWGNKWSLGDGLSPAQFKNKLQSLDYNTYINAQNYKGETPLDKAHYFQKPEIEQLLKKYGGKYNIYKQLNAEPSQQELNDLLFNNLFIKIIALKRGANPNARDSEGMTPLHALAQSADYGTPGTNFTVLLAYGADINAEDDKGYTPYGYVQDSEIAKIFQQRDARLQQGKKSAQRNPQQRRHARRGKC